MIFPNGSRLSKMAYNNNKNLTFLVRSALKEDIGRLDITTQLTIPKDKIIKAVLLAKQDCVVCGLDIAGLVFKAKDNKVQFKPAVKDGDSVKQGKILASLKGRAQAILTAERVALNYLCLLSGIATQTKSFVNAIRPYQTKIMDTRKTIPGLRALEKYAVRTGGGHNHRMRLDELVLIKDNHLKVMDYGCLPVIRRKIPSKIKIEIEAKTLEEFKAALELEPDIIMLDNMSVTDMKKAVAIRNRLSPNPAHPAPKLEASGRIGLTNVKQVAATGVEMISVGALTHSVNSADISLEVL